jgi:tetratricopeptide (TPR) repeat protein
MKMKATTFFASLVVLGTAGALLASGSSPGEKVPLYDNLGRYHHQITTSVPLAQRYFDQGLRLVYAFNHAEAIRAFREAERLDPACAMCPWGVALALGPNINAPMDSASGVQAFEAIQRARQRVSRARPAERALIGALSQRYSKLSPADRTSLDSAYARAMAQVARDFPGNAEAQVLYADALMNLSPWNYWTNGEPRPGTAQIMSSLERVLAEDADHPGACHLFIHAKEAHAPARAVPCAERLAALMPGAGHLVHMPAHIYIRVGRYADAITSNEHAVHADESYFEGPQETRNGLYGKAYYPHNYHFLSFAAAMAGNSHIAIESARKTMERIDPVVAGQTPWIENVTGILYGAYVTFARYDEILAEPIPGDELPYARGIAQYARGIAYAEKKQWTEAAASMDTLIVIRQRFAEGENKKALGIALESLRGEIAFRAGEEERAVYHFTRAVALEDQLGFAEPPSWYYPARQSLGQVLLLAEKAAEAEAVFRQDLENFPENGWSLKGLEQSLRAQGRAEEAAEVQRRFDQAWRAADVQISSSRM